MQKFLERAASHIYAKHKNELGQIALVLPNQRANLFLRKHFSKQLEKASWSPKFLSIEDFIREISGLQLIDNIDLVIELYSVHKKIEKEKAESLEDFMQWANTLLQDFNEIDRYLLDADSLFEHLTDIQRIKYWDPKADGFTKFQKENIQFWTKLKEYYHLFQKRLLDEKKAYQGLSYRIAAEGISRRFLEGKDFKRVYFIGFNALTKAENQIINFFIQNEHAEMLYDSDSYYMADSIQEAGKFLRPIWREEQENFRWLFNNFVESNKKIHVNGLKGNIAQVKAVGNYLRNIPTDQLSETAIILADENVLPVLLDSLPTSVEKANITMGLPLDAGPVYLFFHEFFQLHLNTERLQEGNFYYKNLLKVLESPILQSSSGNDTGKLRKKINQDKLFYISKKKMEELQIANEIKPLFQCSTTNVGQLIETLLNFIDLAKEHSVEDPLQNEYLFQFMKIFKRLENLIVENSETEINLKSAYGIFKQMAASSTIPFYGEPLQGLQIMGVLESRTLDFKNVIFLSLNEGVLPAGKSNNSFIPYDIKIEKGLPSYKEKDAIFAYHFYRLIQRAENIELFYNSQSDSLNGGEESRFIKQLLQEIPSKAPNSTIEKKNLNPALGPKGNSEVIIPKTDAILEQIQKHLEKGISPSALSTFLTCPLDYYYKYILGMSPLDETEESLQAHTFGSITHEALENLYKPFLGEFLSTGIINKIAENAERELQKSFAMQKFQIKTGKNHLIYQVALQYIQNFLVFEKNRIKKTKDKIQLLLLEKSFECSLDFQFPDKNPMKVKLKGKADRIEKEGNLIRIIDFKTGGFKDSDLNIKSPEDFLLPEKSKALQLMMYSLIFNTAYPQNKMIPSIFLLRLPSKGFLTFSKNTLGLEQEEIDEGRKVVKKAISALFDQDLPFRHSADASYCNFCS